MESKFYFSYNVSLPEKVSFFIDLKKLNCHLSLNNFFIKLFKYKYLYCFLSGIQTIFLYFKYKTDSKFTTLSYIE